MTVREDCAVEEVKEGEIITLTGENVGFDECLWCTQAEAPEWLKATGLPLGNAFEILPFSVCLQGKAHDSDVILPPFYIL